MNDQGPWGVQEILSDNYDNERLPSPAPVARTPVARTPTPPYQAPLSSQIDGISFGSTRDLHPSSGIIRMNSSPSDITPHPSNISDISTLLIEISSEMRKGFAFLSASHDTLRQEIQALKEIVLLQSNSSTSPRKSHESDSPEHTDRKRVGRKTKSVTGTVSDRSLNRRRGGNGNRPDDLTSAPVLPFGLPLFQNPWETESLNPQSPGTSLANTNPLVLSQGITKPLASSPVGTVSLPGSAPVLGGNQSPTLPQSSPTGIQDIAPTSPTTSPLTGNEPLRLGNHKHKRSQWPHSAKFVKSLDVERVINAEGQREFVPSPQRPFHRRKSSPPSSITTDALDLQVASSSFSKRSSIPFLEDFDHPEELVTSIPTPSSSPVSIPQVAQPFGASPDFDPLPPSDSPPNPSPLTLSPSESPRDEQSVSESLLPSEVTSDTDLPNSTNPSPRSPPRASSRPELSSISNDIPERRRRLAISEPRESLNNISIESGNDSRDGEVTNSSPSKRKSQESADKRRRSYAEFEILEFKEEKDKAKGRERSATSGIIPQAKAVAAFVDDEDDLTVSEEEAFQQAWVELENEKQRKITSLGPKDFDRLLSITNRKLHEKQENAAADEVVLHKQSKERRREKRKNKFIITHKYKGPHIPETITLDVIENLISAFEKQELLHYKYAWELVTLCTAIFESEPNLCTATIPHDGRVVVVGDMHGQLIDLVTILRKAGWPSKSNIYVFNGDFVDRGPQGAEVMFILFCLKLLFPDEVIIHRGNHEEKRINRLYSYETEIRAKYDGKMFDHIANCFTMLPIGSVLQKTCLIVHGGLPKEENVTLDEIRKYLSLKPGCLTVRINRKRELPKPDLCTTRESKILEALLWSDPVENTDEWLDSNRGAGVYWGKNVTKRFMTLNDLELLVRSHQLCATGRKYNHLKFVMTIFSASYYCGINNNKGAVALFDEEGGVSAPKFLEYHAEIGASTVGDNMTQKGQTLQKIRARIYKNRRKLYEVFSAYDLDHTGIISKKKWIKCMGKVLKLPLLWGKLYPYLVVNTPDEIKHGLDGKVKYIAFLERFKIDLVGEDSKKWIKLLTKKYVDKIKGLDLTLEDSFKKFECDSEDGTLHYSTIINNLIGYNFGMSKTMLFDFVRTLDKRKDGRVDLEEYIQSLEPQFERAVGPSDLPWIKAVIGSLSTSIGDSQKLREIYKELAPKKTPNELTYKAFTKLLLQVSPGEGTAEDGTYSETERRKLFSFLDTRESDAVHFEDLETALFGSNFLNNRDSFVGSDFISEEMQELIYHNRYLLRDILRRMDEDASGFVDVLEFKAAFEVFSELIESHFNHEQIESIVRQADPDSDGSIDYENFIKSLRGDDLPILVEGKRDALELFTY